MIWLFSDVLIPIILFRVVCALDVTMDIFSPRTLFKSVDFPTFGLPMIATYPERKFSITYIFVDRHERENSNYRLYKFCHRLSYPLNTLSQVFHGCSVRKSYIVIIPEYTAVNKGDIGVFKEIYGKV